MYVLSCIIIKEQTKIEYNHQQTKIEYNHQMLKDGTKGHQYVYILNFR